MLAGSSEAAEMAMFSKQRRTLLRHSPQWMNIIIFEAILELLVHQRDQLMEPAKAVQMVAVLINIALRLGLLKELVEPKQSPKIST